jgi:adenylate kinase family enzyme
MHRSTAGSLGLSQRSTVKWNNSLHSAAAPAAESTLLYTNNQIEQFSQLNDKQRLLALHLAKFESRGAENRLADAESKELAESTKTEKLRALQLQAREKLKTQSEFRSQWNSAGTELHQANLAVSHEREDAEQRFKLQQRSQAKEAVGRKRTEAQLEMRGGIEQFERNLERIGVNSATPSAKSYNFNATTPNSFSAIDSNLNEYPPHSGNSADAAAAHIAALSLTLPSNAAANAAASAHLAKIHTATAAAAQAQRDRERRRRRVLLAQGAALQEAEEQRQHKKFLEKVNLQSEAEKTLAESIYRARCYGEIIEKNIEIAAEEERKARELAHQQALQRDKEVYESEKAKYQQNLQEELQKFQLIRAEQDRILHQNNSNYCRELVGNLVEISFKTATHRALSSNPQEKLVPAALWRDWMALFIAGKSLAPANNNGFNASAREELAVGIAAAQGMNLDLSSAFTPRSSALSNPSRKAHSSSGPLLSPAEEIKHFLDVLDINRKNSHAALNLIEGAEESAEFLDQQYFQDYLQGAAEWEISGLNLAENCPKENRLLGALVERVVAVASGKELAPDLPEVPRYPLHIIILGKPFAGKASTAQQLAQKFNLKVFSLEILINETLTALENAELAKKQRAHSANKASTGSFTSETPNSFGKRSSQQGLGLKIKKALAKNEPLSDELAVGLILERVKRLEEEPDRERSGWILLDFPHTAKQAQLLEKELSGFELPKPVKIGAPKITKSKKEKRNSAIARPLSPREPAQGPYPTFLSLVFMLEIDNESAARRCLGRRIDPVTNNLYHLDYNEPSMQEIIKERLIKLPGAEAAEQKLPQQFSQFHDNEQELRQWFSLFGEQLVVRIDAAQSAEEVREQSREAVRNFLDKKNQQEEAQNSAAAAAGAVENSNVSAEEALPADEIKKVELQTAAVPAIPPINTNLAAPAALAEEINYLQPKLENLYEFLGFYDVELAALLAEKFISLEHSYSATVKLIFRHLRKERINNLDYLASVRENYMRVLRAPDSKQNALEQFQLAINKIPVDLRGDIAVKEELIYRSQELVEQLYRALDQKKVQLEGELAAISEDNYLDQHIHLFILFYSKLIQLELDRYFQSIRIAQDYFAVLKGIVVFEMNEPKLFTLPIFTNSQEKTKDKRKSKNLSQNNAPSGPSAAATASTPTAFAGKSRKSKNSGKSVGSTAEMASPSPFAEVLELIPQVLITPEQALEQIINETVENQARNKAKTGPIKPKVKAESPRAGNVSIEEPNSGRGEAKMGPSAPSTVKSATNSAKIKKINVVIERKQRAAAEELFDSQLRHIVATENSILLARVAKIAHNGAAEISQFRANFFVQLLPKLEKWLALRIKGETAAIHALSGYLKQNIERELLPPINFQLRLEGESLFLDEDLMNQEPPALPRGSLFTQAKQNAENFSLQQLNHLAQQIKLNAQGDIVDSGLLLDLLERLASNSSRAELEEALPLQWNGASRQEIAQFLAQFDPNQSKFIDWREFILSLGLNEAVGLPSEELLLEAREKFLALDTDLDGYINFSEFSRVPLWFDRQRQARNNNSGDVNNSKNDIEGLHQLKYFLFNLFAAPSTQILAERKNQQQDNPFAAANHLSLHVQPHDTQIHDVVPYMALLMYFCHRDATHTGAAKLQALLQNSSLLRPVTSLQASFVSRVSSSGIHSSRFDRQPIAKLSRNQSN